MPRRNTIELSPPKVRAAFEEFCQKNGFSKYEELAAMLAREYGIKVNKSTVVRAGQKLQRRTEAIKIATANAEAICQVLGESGAQMEDAALALAQEKIFSVLMDGEFDLTPQNLKMLTSSVALIAGKYTNIKAVRQRINAQKKEAAAQVAKLSGLDKKTRQTIQRALLGITG